MAYYPSLSVVTFPTGYISLEFDISKLSHDGRQHLQGEARSRVKLVILLMLVSLVKTRLLHL